MMDTPTIESIGLAEPPPFTTAWVDATFGAEFRRRGAGDPGEMFYTGPFYNGRIPRSVREERRALVTRNVPHVFTVGEGSRKHICRICQFPAADAPCYPADAR